MHNYATFKFVSDKVNPYLPAGTFELNADPLSFLDSTCGRRAMTRTLETIMLPFTSPAASAIPNDANGALRMFDSPQPGIRA
jgi:hypothetical protein